MNILFVLHADFEQPGVILDWAKQNGHTISVVSPYAGEALPDVETFDLLVSMGGPQSSSDNLPYLKSEISLMHQAVTQGRKVLGICLGAQLIGEALGAPVKKSPQREIGEFPVELTSKGQEDPLLRGFPQRFNAVHWHSEMPGLPEGGVVLMSSAGCPRQMIRFADNAYGFQCHIEMTNENLSAMLAHCSDDLAPGPYVQNQEAFESVDHTERHHLIREFLTKWTSRG